MANIWKQHCRQSLDLWEMMQVSRTDFIHVTYWNGKISVRWIQECRSSVWQEKIHRVLARSSSGHFNTWNRDISLGSALVDLVMCQHWWLQAGIVLQWQVCFNDNMVCFSTNSALDNIWSSSTTNQSRAHQSTSSTHFILDICWQNQG
jgi:hypothetical protein